MQIEKDVINSPERVSLDSISLADYINTSKVVKKLDTNIAKIMNFNIVDIPMAHIGTFLPKLAYFSIETIEDLNATLIENETLITENFILPKERYKNIVNVEAGISIFYLVQILLGKTKNKDQVIAFLTKFSIGDRNERDKDADFLIGLHNK